MNAIESIAVSDPIGYYIYWSAIFWWAKVWGVSVLLLLSLIAGLLWRRM